MPIVKSATVELIDNRGWYCVNVVYSDLTTTCIADDEKGKWFKENINLAQAFAERLKKRIFAPHVSFCDANPYVY